MRVSSIHVRIRNCEYDPWGQRSKPTASSRTLVSLNPLRLTTLGAALYSKSEPGDRRFRRPLPHSLGRQ